MYKRQLIYNTPESLSEQQPFNHSPSQTTITADARLDNREFLIKDLAANQNTPDGELILLAYLKYGEDCVQHLIGAYSFAIWDGRKNHFFCVRDHMGVRPFYYYHDQYFFAFSSCKQGLLAIPELDKSINNEYIINQVIKSKQKPISTFFKKIKRLLPAHTLVGNKDGSRERKYWTLNIQKETKFKKEEDYVLAFQENLAEAVQCRLRSHKNVGMELSGGLDSSGICLLYTSPSPRDATLSRMPSSA